MSEKAKAADVRLPERTGLAARLLEQRTDCCITLRTGCLWYTSSRDGCAVHAAKGSSVVMIDSGVEGSMSDSRIFRSICWLDFER